MNLSSLFKNEMIKRIFKLRAFPLLGLILFGLALRLMLAPFSSDPNDIRVLYIVTNDLLAGLKVYTTNSFSYPPLWAYIEFPVYRFASFFVSPKLFGVRVDTLSVSTELWKFPPIITSSLFNILCKLPLIAADLLIGLIIYYVVKDKGDEKLARASFILWFLNPLVIAIDAVQGQFDVLPTLMTVLSFCLFFRRNYFASGIAIGLGALFKIYPVFLVPLYLFFIAAAEIKVNIAENIRQVFTGCLRFFMGILFSLSVFLIPLINTNLIHNVFARTGILPSVGGLTPFSIMSLPGMYWLFYSLVRYSTQVSLILVAICFAVISLIGLISFKGRKNPLKAFVYANSAAILIIYMTSLTVNPQYILWVLPFLILTYGIYRGNFKKIIVFSISGVAFLIGLNGPLLFYPLAIFAPVFTPEMILSSKYLFDNNGGWIALVVGSVLGAITLIFCLIDTISTLLKNRKTEMSHDLQRRKLENGTPCLEWRFIKPTKILAVFLVFMILGQVLVYTQPLANQTVSFDVLSFNMSKDLVGINYGIKSGNYPADLQIIATASPAIQQITDKEILIYYDDYPSLAVSRAGWIGLLDHIPVELQLRNYQGTIKIVNAVGLRHEMETNFNSIVIIPSGVFPATVHDENRSLVGNWIRAGGTLIWIGDAFAYYSGYSTGGVSYFSTASMIISQNQTLGFALFNGTLTGDESYATIPSNFSNALDLRYSWASTGAYISRIQDYGGIVLGKTTDSENARTAIACVPIGNGHLILFGGGVGTPFTATGEDVVAHDIAQILCSGTIFSTGTIAYQFHELNANEIKNGSITVLTPIDKPAGIIIDVFSKSPYIYFFSRKFYIVNPG
jgi:hypothetical protein